MKRWLIVLSLAMVLGPDFALAAVKPAEPSLWQRLTAVLSPKPPPQVRVRSARAASHGVAAVPPPVQVPMPRARESENDKPLAVLSDVGCNGGQRIISAYYWEGRHTASGEPFDPHAMTAAHRTLPFGTHLNVTNPRTGKSVVVVINDRGPFVRGVSLDLSLGAAQAIGMHGTGAVCIP